uniref:SWI/SNF complex subunit SWI3A n=1 Tax=Kalanchoe fedtschenkoi TaxID=63787 RepID=A0A7N0U7E0_KALFE
METSTTHEAISLNSSIPAEHELYTIPSSSGWFDWNGIHEIERAALKEFFDSSSYTRTPKVYREYRDFIINKFREEPTRRLTFTEIRKALVGDVSLLHKVFGFLEQWGLINFGVDGVGGELGFDGEGKVEARVEEGAPVGVRVVAMPGSGKPLSDPLLMGSNGGLLAGGFKFPPLASYTDVFGDLMKSQLLVCSNCGDKCESGHYRSEKGSNLICKKCYGTKNCGEGNTMEDFKSYDNDEVVWTDEETLLLLESVAKHGDDWELIRQTVKTKSKFDCIAKLITLPLGDFVLGSDHGLINPGTNSEHSVKDVQTPSSKLDETVKTEGITTETTKPMQNGDTDFGGSPTKKICIDRSSIMKQVDAHTSLFFY